MPNEFLPNTPGATATELRQIADANVELALVRQAAAIRAEELSWRKTDDDAEDASCSAFAGACISENFHD